MNTGKQVLECPIYAWVVDPEEYNPNVPKEVANICMEKGWRFTPRRISLSQKCMGT